MGGIGMGGMALWMLVWGLVGLVLLVSIVVAIVWWIRHTDNGQGGGPSAASPEEILKRRYATGEIDEDEYLRRRAGLT